MRNVRSSSLHILAGEQDGSMKIEIHGRLGRVDEQIRVRSVVREFEPPPPVFIDDPTLSEGEQELVIPAENGYRVSSYREVLRDGEVVSSDLLSMNVYDAVQETYSRGTGTR
jgi:uncharacterized protein YabE (DUF348 family)